MQRVPLVDVCLLAKSLGVASISDFLAAAPDPPPAEAVAKAIKELQVCLCFCVLLRAWRVCFAEMSVGFSRAAHSCLFYLQYVLGCDSYCVCNLLVRLRVFMCACRCLFLLVVALQELGALTASQELTSLGRLLALLPGTFVRICYVGLGFAEGDVHAFECVCLGVMESGFAQHSPRNAPASAQTLCALQLSHINTIPSTISTHHQVTSRQPAWSSTVRC